MNRKRLFLVILVIVGFVALSACDRLFVPTRIETPSPQQDGPPKVSIPPTSSATISPPAQRPRLPSATNTVHTIQTMTSTVAPWQGYPAPTMTPATAIPPPAQAVSLPPGFQVILLLGTDNNAPYVGRTDTILLVILNPQGGVVSLLSIPRDLFVYVPGYTMQRINTAFGVGGIELVSLTLEYNLGLRPQHWALAHLDDFSRFVDDLGGVEVQVTAPVTDPWCQIPVGTIQMNGYTALCYVRSRTGNSDLDRNRRQQDLIAALFQRFLSLDSLRHLPTWYSSYRSSVETDLALEDLLPLIPLAFRIQENGIYNFQIGWDQVSTWHVPDTGAAVLLPRRDKIHFLIQQMIDVLIPPMPTSVILETRIAELTSTSTVSADEWGHSSETPTPFLPLETPLPTEVETPAPNP